MSYYIPGKVLHEETESDGSVLKYTSADWNDLDDMNNFINALSKEDAHDLFAGETIYISEHASYLSNVFMDSEFGHTVLIFLRRNGEFVGFGGVYRERRKRTRSMHVGIFHIGIDSKYRNKGYGFKLGKVILETAKTELPGITHVELDCFGNNPAGLALYNKLGFSEVGRIPERYSYKNGFVDMVLMSQKIV